MNISILEYLMGKQPEEVTKLLKMHNIIIEEINQEPYFKLILGKE